MLCPVEYFVLHFVILLLLIFVVGCAAYNSTITNHAEILPIRVDLPGKEHFSNSSILYTRTIASNMRNLAVRLSFLSSAAKASDGLVVLPIEDILAASLVNVMEAGETSLPEGHFYLGAEDKVFLYRVVSASVKIALSICIGINRRLFFIMYVPLET